MVRCELNAFCPVLKVKVCSSVMFDTVLYLQCVQYVDESVLPELVPRLTELIKSGIGVGTKVSPLGCTWMG